VVRQEQVHPALSAGGKGEGEGEGAPGRFKGILHPERVRQPALRQVVGHDVAAVEGRRPGPPGLREAHQSHLSVHEDGIPIGRQPADECGASRRVQGLRGRKDLEGPHCEKEDPGDGVSAPVPYAVVGGEGGSLRPPRSERGNRQAHVPRLPRDGGDGKRPVLQVLPGFHVGPGHQGIPKVEERLDRETALGGLERPVLTE
jgi:hypothetical protein